MTKLKSFGCSFIFGDDLHDADITAQPREPSRHTWPALLAKHLDLPYQCYAEGGSGNLKILESVLTQLSDPEPTLFIIGWSWIDRFDYINNVTRKWNSILPGNVDDTSKFYYQHLHSQYRDKLATLIYINTAIDAIQSHNHKFIMTCQDDLIFETKWHTTPSIELLQKFIKSHITQFQNRTFLDWSRHNNYKISAAWHPLEDAHQAAFEYIRGQSLV